MQETQENDYRLIAPENDRYRARLLLLHGLWMRPELWRPVALAFAQRGWWSEAADLRQPASGGLENWVEAAGRYALEGDRPAIAIGYDLGALVALKLAAEGKVQAAVAVAPPLEGLGRAIAAATRFRAWFGVGEVAPPTAGHPWLGTSLGSRTGMSLARGLCPESAALVRSCRGQALQPAAPRVPTLLAAQEGDAIVPRFLLELTATGIEADFVVLPGGRLPMAGNRIDLWASALQRWIVQRAGADLLTLRGDEDLLDDPLSTPR